MLRAFEIKLYPNKEQEKYLAKVFGCYRKVYNLCLDKAITEYENGNRCNSLSDFGGFFHKELLKNEEFNYLNECNTKILKDSISNLSTAFKNFFKKPNKDTGFPNFKKRTNEQSIGLYSEAFSKKVFEKDNFLFISKKFGEIRYRTSPEYKEIISKYKNEIKRITVVKTLSNEYFAKVLINYKHRKTIKTPINEIIGIDLGIKDFVITSDGEIFENLKFTRKNEKKLKKLQKRLSKKVLVKTDKTYYNKKYKKEVVVKQPSKNREKARVKLSKLNNKIRNQKKNYLHTVTSTLLNDNQIIVMEDLNVKGMMKNHKLAKAIQEVNLGEFKTILRYKSEWYGREIVEIDRFFPSSKLCSVCGYKNTLLKLKDREWLCPECGTHHDRDINASVNIREEGKRKIGSRCPEFIKLEDCPLMDDKELIPLKSNGSMIQEEQMEIITINCNNLTLCL